MNKIKIKKALNGFSIGTVIGVLLGLLFPKQAVALYEAERRLIRSIMGWIKAVCKHSLGETHIESHPIPEDEVPPEFREPEDPPVLKLKI